MKLFSFLKYLILNILKKCHDWQISQFEKNDLENVMLQFVLNLRQIGWGENQLYFVSY